MGGISHASVCFQKNNKIPQVVFGFQVKQTQGHKGHAYAQDLPATNVTVVLLSLFKEWCDVCHSHTVVVVYDIVA